MAENHKHRDSGRFDRDRSAVRDRSGVNDRSGATDTRRLRESIINVQRHTVGWLEEGARLLMLFVGTFAANALLIGFGKGFWHSYRHTAVGKHMLAADSPLFIGLDKFGELPTVTTALLLTAEPLLFVLAVAVVAHFFQLRALLWSGQSWLFKAMWIPPLAIALCWLLPAFSPIEPGVLAWVLALAPAACLLPGCMTFAERAFPDLGTLLTGVWNWLRNLF